MVSWRLRLTGSELAGATPDRGCHGRNSVCGRCAGVSRRGLQINIRVPVAIPVGQHPMILTVGEAKQPPGSLHYGRVSSSSSIPRSD